MAIGARAQAAKTYLEKHYESFPKVGLWILLFHNQSRELAQRGFPGWRLVLVRRQLIHLPPTGASNRTWSFQTHVGRDGRRYPASTFEPRRQAS